MSLAEAGRLATILRADPSSMLAAAYEGWDYPVPRTDAVLMDLYDLQFATTGAKQRKAYPRPWAQEENSTRRGNAAGRTPREVMEILAQFGHPVAPGPPV